jgi:hypothetical protein
MNPFLVVALILAPGPIILGPLWLYIRWEERRHTDVSRIRLPETDIL